VRYNAEWGVPARSSSSLSLSSGSVFFIKCRSEANNEPCWQVSVPKSLCMIDLTWMDWQVRRQANRTERYGNPREILALMLTIHTWGYILCRSSNAEYSWRIKMHIQESRALWQYAQVVQPINHGLNCTTSNGPAKNKPFSNSLQMAV